MFILTVKFTFFIFIYLFNFLLFHLMIWPRNSWHEDEEANEDSYGCEYSTKCKSDYEIIINTLLHMNLTYLSQVLHTSNILFKGFPSNSATFYSSTVLWSLVRYLLILLIFRGKRHQFGGLSSVESTKLPDSGNCVTFIFATIRPSNTNLGTLDIENVLILPHKSWTKQNPVGIVLLISSQTIHSSLGIHVQVLRWIPQNRLALTVDIFCLKFDDWVAQQVLQGAVLLTFSIKFSIKIKTTDLYTLTLTYKALSGTIKLVSLAVFEVFCCFTETIKLINKALPHSFWQISKSSPWINESSLYIFRTLECFPLNCHKIDRNKISAINFRLFIPSDSRPCRFWALPQIISAHLHESTVLSKA